MALEYQKHVGDGNITVYVLTGRLALGRQCTYLEDDIRKSRQEGVAKLVLDLSGLESIDSAVPGMLTMSLATMERAGGSLRVAAPAARVLEAIPMTRLDQFLPIDPDAESACAALSAAQA